MVGERIESAKEEAALDSRQLSACQPLAGGGNREAGSGTVGTHPLIPSLRGRGGLDLPLDPLPKREGRPDPPLDPLPKREGTAVTYPLIPSLKGGAAVTAISDQPLAISHALPGAGRVAGADLGARGRCLLRCEGRVPGEVKFRRAVRVLLRTVPSWRPGIRGSVRYRCGQTALLSSGPLSHLRVFRPTVARQRLVCCQSYRCAL